MGTNNRSESIDPTPAESNNLGTSSNHSRGEDSGHHSSSPGRDLDGEKDKKVRRVESWERLYIMEAFSLKSYSS